MRWMKRPWGGVENSWVARPRGWQSVIGSLGGGKWLVVCPGVISTGSSAVLHLYWCGWWSIVNLSRFADETKLRGVVYTHPVHLGHQQYALLKRISMTSQAALGKVLPADGGRWPFPFIQLWRGHTWDTMSDLGLLSTEETWTFWWEYNEGYKNSSHIMKTLRGPFQPRKMNSLGDTINIYKYLNEAWKHDGQAHFSGGQWQNQRQWVQTRTQNSRKHIFLW